MPNQIILRYVPITMKSIRAAKLASNALEAERIITEDRRRSEAKLRKHNQEFKKLFALLDTHLNLVRKELLAAAVEGQSDYLVPHEACERLYTANEACSRAAVIAQMEEPHLPRIFLPISTNYQGYATSESATFGISESKVSRLRKVLLETALSLDAQEVRNHREFLTAMQSRSLLDIDCKPEQVDAVANALPRPRNYKFQRDFSNLQKWTRLLRRSKSFSADLGLWVVWDWSRAIDSRELTKAALSSSHPLTLISATKKPIDSNEHHNILSNPELLQWISSAAQPALQGLFDAIIVSAQSGQRRQIIQIDSKPTTSMQVGMSFKSHILQPCRILWSPPGLEPLEAMRLLHESLSALGYAITKSENCNDGCFQVTW